MVAIRVQTWRSAWPKPRSGTRRRLMAEVAGIADQLRANETAFAEIQHQLAEVTCASPNPAARVGAAGQ